MRYPADHREKTRQRILDAAATVFRRMGFQAASVDIVMAEAGLTAGGFYAHFSSKEELFAESFLQTLRQARTLTGKSVEQLQGAERINAIVKRYLSPTHRDMIDAGCPLPPLLADLPRQKESTRQAFDEILRDIVASLEPHLADNATSPPSEQAMAILALMIGGISLSRAVANETLAQRVLMACRKMAAASLAEPTVTQSSPEPSKSKAASEPKRKKSP